MPRGCASCCHRAARLPPWPPRLAAAGPRPAGPGRAAGARAGSPGPAPVPRQPAPATARAAHCRSSPAPPWRPRVTRTLRPPNPAACSTAIATRTALSSSRPDIRSPRATGTPVAMLAASARTRSSPEEHGSPPARRAASAASKSTDAISAPVMPSRPGVRATSAKSARAGQVPCPISSSTAASRPSSPLAHTRIAAARSWNVVVSCLLGEDGFLSPSGCGPRRPGWPGRRRGRW